METIHPLEKRLFGLNVRLGSSVAVTVRVAEPEYCVPAELLPEHRKTYPFIAIVAPVIDNVPPVVPEYGAEAGTFVQVLPPSVLYCHCRVDVGVPEAIAVNDALPPEAVLAADGLWVNVAVAPIVTVQDWLTAELGPLLACTVNVYVPAWVGVPESTPLVEFSASPGGRLPENSGKVGAGVPLAANVKL